MFYLVPYRDQSDDPILLITHLVRTKPVPFKLRQKRNDPSFILFILPVMNKPIFRVFPRPNSPLREFLSLKKKSDGCPRDIKPAKPRRYFQPGHPMTPSVKVFLLLHL